LSCSRDSLPTATVTSPMEGLSWASRMPFDPDHVIRHFDPFADNSFKISATSYGKRPAGDHRQRNPNCRPMFSTSRPVIVTLRSTI
ncbi:MAG TPA: hypothetical protein PLZ37_17875, partial [Nitrospira sp.]|nr:hypothetical protein [Nitrospira sp.]